MNGIRFSSVFLAALLAITATGILVQCGGDNDAAAPTDALPEAPVPVAEAPTTPTRVPAADAPNPLALIPAELAGATLVSTFDIRTIGELGGLDVAAKAISLATHRQGDILKRLELDLTTDIAGCLMLFNLNDDLEPEVATFIIGKWNPAAFYTIIDEYLPDTQDIMVEGFELRSVVLDGMEVVFGLADDRLAVAGMAQMVGPVLARYQAAGALDALTLEGAIQRRMANLDGTITLSINPDILDMEELQEPLRMISVEREDIASIGLNIDLHAIQRIGMTVRAQVDFEDEVIPGMLANMAVGAMELAKGAEPLSRLMLDDISIEAQGTALRFESEPQFGVDVATMGILAGMLLPVVGRTREAANHTICRNNLRQVHTAAAILHMDGHTFTLKELFDSGLIDDPNVFICPDDENPHSAGGWQTSYESIFDLVETKISLDKLRLNEPMIWDSRPRHAGIRMVLYGDGHVVPVSEQHFHETLKQALERLQPKE